MNFSLNRHTQQKLRMDLTRRPFVDTSRGNKPVGLLLTLFGLLFGGVPLFFTIKALLDGRIDASLMPALIFGGIGAGVIMLGLWIMTKTVKTTITDDTVSQESTSLFGRNYWEEPRNNFTGILHRSEYHSGSKNSSGYTLYIVELHHPDRKKRVRLHTSRSPDGIRGIWEDCARALDMPALEEDGNTIKARAVEDLNKSVRDLVDEGKLDIQFDTSTPTPRGLMLSTGKDCLRIQVKSTGPKWIGLLIGMIFSVFFIYIVFFMDTPIIFNFIGSVFLIVIISAIAWELISRTAIDVSPAEVRLFRLMPWGETTGNILKTSDIESVRIGEKPDSHQKAVLIATNQKNMALGAGLSKEAQEWLKNCILTVITR